LRDSRPRARVVRRAALGVAALTRGVRAQLTAEGGARRAQIALYDLPTTILRSRRASSASPPDESPGAVRRAPTRSLITLVVGDYDTIAQDLSRLDLGQPSVPSADAF
jgi:hypothetical protein